MTLRSSWEAYYLRYVSLGASRAQIERSKHAFYAGAKAVLKALTADLPVTGASMQDIARAEKTLEGILEELKVYHL